MAEGNDVHTQGVSPLLPFMEHTRAKEKWQENSSLMQVDAEEGKPLSVITGTNIDEQQLNLPARTQYDLNAESRYMPITPALACSCNGRQSNRPILSVSAYLTA